MTAQSASDPEVFNVWSPPPVREWRVNRLKKALQEGQCATTLYGLGTPEMVDYFGQFGFEGIWMEWEHTPPVLSLKDLGNMSRACDLWGISSVVRVPNDPWIIQRVLDAGCDGVAVPHVKTKEAAEAVVRAVKYGPIGRRGDYLGRQSVGVADGRTKSNEQTSVILFIEEVEGIKNFDEILTVEHVDAYFIGAGDLSQDMGMAGQRYHPDVQKIVDDCIAKCVAAGKVAGCLVNDEDVEDYIEKGARYFQMGWQSWVARGALQYVDKVKRKMASLNG